MTKGTLKHTSGLEIPNVERTEMWEDGDFNVRLVPKADTHYFLSEQGWSFVPDKKPLPEPDNVVIVQHMFYPIIGLHDKWYQVQSGVSLREVTEEKVRNAMKNPKTKMFKSGVELNKEDYA